MSENTNHTHPDARHLIWVARNLLWQAHENFMWRGGGLDPEKIATQIVICNSIKTAMALIDDLRERLVKQAPVPCTDTTMPPCEDHAWQHFLAHVQACYLPPQESGAAPVERQMSEQEPAAWAVFDDAGVQHSLWFLEEDAKSEAKMVSGTVARLGSPTLTDAEREAIEASREYWQSNADCALGDETDRKHAAALRGLLERNKRERPRSAATTS